MLAQRIELRALHLLQLAVHHAEAEVVAQRAFVARKKVPVQRVVRAGAVTHLELLVVVAAAAVVAHAVDVGGAAHVGLGGQQAAVGKLAHAHGVGHLHPFKGVDVHAQVPAVHGGGVESRQQREVADDHEALDVVGIGTARAIAPPHAAGSACGSCTGPEPLRQRRGVAQGVALVVAGHVGPVDAAHVFAPAQDLADEALHRRQRRGAGLPCGLGARCTTSRGCSILVLRANDSSEWKRCGLLACSWRLRTRQSAPAWWR